jgi:hypothetical protein
MSDKIKPHHLGRKAILYVRQSSAHQVMHNQESRILQYAMRARLRELGWHEIEVIDDDLGRSAAGAVTRSRGQLPPSDRGCTNSECKDVGTPRRHQPLPPLARPRQGQRGPRPPRAGLRMVHRRFRHARSEGREGAARRAELSGLSSPARLLYVLLSITPGKLSLRTSKPAR